MADRTKLGTTGAKTVKTKRPSTTSVAASSRTKIVLKEKITANRPKKVDQDATILSYLNKEQCLPDFDNEARQIAYGRFMRAMLEECLVEEKIEREETQLDLQMTQLAERFQKTMDQLDKTNRRLKDISFVVEQKRHAGYSYCGACAAFAYRQISPVVVKRIFILGPSHHVRLGGCALSSLDKYQTPLYDLTIDKQIYAELEASRQFEWMDVQTDEDEHSIEMHLPYIAKVMEEYKNSFTIVPMLVGSLSTDVEAKYGAILAPYLADPQNLFIISSDFCHWGSRFRYTWRDSSRGPIHQSIEWLDKQGMEIIEHMDPRAFSEYLNKYGNTICGRHPIGVLLQAIAKLRSQNNSPRMSMKFLKYAQSSQCMNMQDSSVSYASASLVFE